MKEWSMIWPSLQPISASCSNIYQWHLLRNHSKKNSIDIIKKSKIMRRYTGKKIWDRLRYASFVKLPLSTTSTNSLFKRKLKKYKKKWANWERRFHSWLKKWRKMEILRHRMSKERKCTLNTSSLANRKYSNKKIWNSFPKISTANKMLSSPLQLLSSSNAANQLMRYKSPILAVSVRYWGTIWPAAKAVYTS